MGVGEGGGGGGEEEGCKDVSRRRRSWSRGGRINNGVTLKLGY